MRITLFSSNQSRHLHLARQLSKVADEVFFVSEVNTLFPGQVNDFFKSSPVMKKYFSNVTSAEKKIFGDINFVPNNVRILPVKSGDLNLLSREQLYGALNSTVYIVFGSSYIKGWLVDFLLQHQAINIHMGLSPYYRGSSCNFWALYDYKPSYVGATIHMLSKGLDSGDMLFHCLPKIIEGDTSFDFTMRSVLVAQQSLVETIRSETIFSFEHVKQDRKKEIRYSRNIEFNDVVAEDFLNRKLKLDDRDFIYPDLLNPSFR